MLISYCRPCQTHHHHHRQHQHRTASLHCRNIHLHYGFVDVCARACVCVRAVYVGDAAPPTLGCICCIVLLARTHTRFCTCEHAHAREGRPCGGGGTETVCESREPSQLSSFGASVVPLRPEVFELVLLLLLLLFLTVHSRRRSVPVHRHII